jgi:hypothetical protein
MSIDQTWHEQLQPSSSLQALLLSERTATGGEDRIPMGNVDGGEQDVLPMGNVVD